MLGNHFSCTLTHHRSNCIWLMLRITNSSTIITQACLQGLEFYCQPITEIHVFKEKYKGDSKRGTGRMKLDSRVYITRAWEKCLYMSSSYIWWLHEKIQYHITYISQTRDTYIRRVNHLTRIFWFNIIILWS